MSGRDRALPPEAVRFRRRLLAALFAVVAGVSVAVLWFARRDIAAREERAFELRFEAALATLRHLRELRNGALLERSRALARKPRIRAAFEDGALDLLYPSARDELRDVIALSGGAPDPLRARFHRFLDASGRVIEPPPDDDAAGRILHPDRLALPGLIARAEVGHVADVVAPGRVSELLATPILSSETGEVISALVLGFEPLRLRPGEDFPGLVSGVRAGGVLNLGGAGPIGERLVRDALDRGPLPEEGRFVIEIGGVPHLVFHKRLHPESRLPEGREVCVFSLADVRSRQRRVTLGVLGAGGVVLLVGGLASQQLAGRFARPVARLAEESLEQRARRRRAEAALESTHEELERVARFSADASHQLKTPVTVLRAGLEEMLARGAIPPAEAEEVAHLVHQTFRLSSVIEDLLLLSRLDAGRLRIRFDEVDLAGLIEASLDDVGASPDDFGLAIEADLPRPLRIGGERRFLALILQNLLENARKYNRPGGRIAIAACEEAGAVRVVVGNTTRRAIPREAQPHVFERFHRGAMGEDVPGYGIGLNLARELARLHGGELRLLCSEEDWTEFELRLRRGGAAETVPA